MYMCICRKIFAYADKKGKDEGLEQHMHIEQTERDAHRRNTNNFNDDDDDKMGLNIYFNFQAESINDAHCSHSRNMWRF